MSNRRRTEGRETWRRLLDWEGGQTPAERLAAHALRMEGFQAIDPSHPLGGPDGLKDLVCTKGGVRYVAAAHFPRGEVSFNNVKAKFLADLRGTARNDATGFAFVTNQELALAERGALVEAAADVSVDLFHLERIASLLDSPPCYGLRLEFLDIEMNHAEQIAFIASRDQMLRDMQMSLDDVLAKLKGTHPELAGDPTATYAGVYALGALVSNPKVSTVAPITLNSPLDLLGRRGLHRCSICGFGFLVQDALPVLTFGERAVACPKCKNVDKYPPY